MFQKKDKKIIIFSSKPETNHSISMIKSAHKNNAKDYELWANDVKKPNNIVSNIWSNSFLGIVKLVIKLKKYNNINLQHEFNVWGAKSLITLPIILFFLRKKNISLCLHSVIDYKKVDKKFIQNFRLKPKIIFLFKFYFFLFFFLVTKFSKKIVVHTEDQKKILNKIYNYKKKITLAHIGIRKLDSKRNNEKKIYDIIIFGYIAPRKGLIELIESLEKNPKKLTILITGGLQDKYKDYYYLIKKKINNSKNNFVLKTNIDDNEIFKLHFQSHIALCGHTELIGTSGPLLTAISCDNLIIAPRKGIFLEILKNDNSSFLFENYSEINNCIENLFTKRIFRDGLKKKLSWFEYVKKNFY